jgi:hypothetical protein
MESLPAIAFARMKLLAFLKDRAISPDRTEPHWFSAIGYCPSASCDGPARRKIMPPGRVVYLLVTIAAYDAGNKFITMVRKRR